MLNLDFEINSIAKKEIEQAVKILRQGGLVAFPTETVYGLGADAKNPAAIKKVFAVKNRPTSHPLIVHLPDASYLNEWALDINPLAWKLANQCWPGPLTLILKKAKHVLNEVTGGQDTVALRVPQHPIALALLEAFGNGVVAPSANRFGYVSPTRASHVQELGQAVGMLLDGGTCPIGIESTIVDMSGDEPILIRPGIVSVEMLQDITGCQIKMSSNKKIRAPGTLLSHYAPRNPLFIVCANHLNEWANNWLNKGKKVFLLSIRADAINNPRVNLILMPAAAEGYGHLLYQTLREVDKQNDAVILVEKLVDSADWAAVQDRLYKAAGSSELLCCNKE